METKFGNLVLHLKGKLTLNEATELVHEVNVPIFFNDLDCHQPERRNALYHQQLSTEIQRRRNSSAR